MIASIRGEVLDVALDHAVIEASGVGYRVNATPSTLSTLRRGTEARLVTAMIVREDSMTLYGFADSDARDLFSTLLSVSGVGPKIALATLAVHDAPALRQALADGDITALTRVPGIGKRSAERMVLELRDKVGPVGAAVGLPAVNGHAVRGPVVEALVGLGFALKQAEESHRQGARQRAGGDAVDGVALGAVACWVTNEPFHRRRRRGARRPRGFCRADRRRRRHRREPAAAIARRVHRTAAGARTVAVGHRGRQEPRRHTGSHPAVRSAWARQDVAGDDHRRRTGLCRCG